MPGDCPKGGNHDWRNIEETATSVTHECRKCKATNTRAKGNKLFVVLMLVMLVACTLAVIWGGAPTS